VPRVAAAADRRSYAQQATSHLLGVSKGMPVKDMTALLLTDVVGSTAMWQARGRELGWPAVVTLLDDLDLGEPDPPPATA
jgi:class 3 adenylate cyclase